MKDQEIVAFIKDSLDNFISPHLDSDPSWLALAKKELDVLIARHNEHMCVYNILTEGETE